MIAAPQRISLGGYTTFTEWNFYQDFTPPLPQHFDSFDISNVNGVSLTVNIQAVGGDSTDPSGNHQNTFWWNQEPAYGGVRNRPAKRRVAVPVTSCSTL